jgi:hypothetical protein
MVVLVGVALVNAALHYQDICLEGQPDRAGVYCTKYVAEPVHTPEREPMSQPIRFISVGVTSSSSSPSSTR